jgi:hypothetical protein
MAQFEMDNYSGIFLEVLRKTEIMTVCSCDILNRKRHNYIVFYLDKAKSLV